jgi:cell division septum initiation protein DivIVA
MASSPAPASRSGTASLSALPTASASAGEGSFSIVSRGYHKGEVDNWVHWALDEIERLGHAIEHAVIQEARSPEGQKLMVDVVRIAADELEGQRQEAEELIAQMITGAEQQAAQILADARQHAGETTTSATSQAQSLINNARAEAKRTTDAATARAAAIDEAAGARMSRFAQLHEDGIERVRRANQAAQQVADVTGQLLQAEADRGSLTDEVSRILSQPGLSQQR